MYNGWFGGEKALLEKVCKSDLNHPKPIPYLSCFFLNADVGQSYPNTCAP